MKVERSCGGALPEETARLVTNIMRVYGDGFFTSTEVARKLEAFQIRGAMRADGWSGYDYRNQVGISVTF